jgi:3-hydroxybutyrate dehydrogenase
VAATYVSGRHALVSGGGSGIGAAYARRLAAAGASVTIADIDVDGARSGAGRSGRKFLAG